MYGSGFFFKNFATFWKMFSLFFKNLVFLENYSTDFHKSGTNGKSARSPVCLHNPLVSFYLTHYLQTSENSEGEYLTLIFGLFFFTFSKTTVPNLSFLNFNRKRGLWQASLR